MCMRVQAPHADNPEYSFQHHFKSLSSTCRFTGWVLFQTLSTQSFAERAAVLRSAEARLAQCV